MLKTHSLRTAPPGFTTEQWDRFMRDGYLVLEGVLGAEEIAQYSRAIERVTRTDPDFDASRFYSRQNAVECDRAFEDLIDRDTHVGFAYDLYGELTKVHMTQFMLRPRNSWRNFWHPDGARGTPFQVFSPQLPLQFKVGYWLTDLPEAGMGNLVVLPGSHRRQYMAGYDTHEPQPEEHVVCLERGAMTLLHCGVWHRVEPNDTATVRKNLFLAYSPSWVCPEDRYQNDPTWLSTLTRERRILMRSYAHPYTNTKPPPDDFPLFLDRDTGTDRDADRYRDHVELHRRKRETFHERLARQRARSAD
jgi:ectoine hydroxylase-related dioxygenase (phytanoyl-CoA dioxygenase family)